MKKLLNVLAILFLVLGLVFTVLPLGTIALLPVALALIFAATGWFTAKDKMAKTLLIVGIALALAVIVKSVAIKPTVADDTDEELQKKEQLEQENLKELEELEGLEELEELEELEGLE